MIDAKELRIGNLIYWNDEQKKGVPHEVVTVSDSGMIHTLPVSLGTLPNDYSPIELSDEWLIKLGFEYAMFHTSDDDGVVRDKMEANKDYFKHPNLPEKFIFYLPYFNMSIYVGNVTIKSVHTLQNLYFALTGKELTIQP